MNMLDRFSYKIKIRDKLLLTFLFISIIPLIILGITQDMLFSNEAGGQFIFILILFVVLTVSIILAILAAKHFDKAIQTLCKGADLFSKENLNHKIVLKTHDELEDLAFSFNDMATQLKSSYENLENKIKDATTQLNDERDKFRNIILSLGEGIIVADEQNNVFIVNPIAEKILKICQKDFIGKNYQDCHKNQDDVTNLVNLSQLQPVERIITYEDKIISINVASIKSSKGNIGAAMIMRDITEKAKLEKQKQEFVSMITHDIKSPLTSIIGFSSLISYNYNDKIDPKIISMIKIIENNANKILFLAEDFVLSNKIESGFNLNFVQIDLVTFLNNLINSFKTQFDDKNLHLTYHCEENIAKISGDEVQLDRAFTNVINNAIKFTPINGKISITVKLIIEENNKFIEISIQDTGIGIPQNEINTIFDKYSRMINTNRTKGTGLGLYITKIIIEAHHGNIKVDSRVGEGTIFYLRLPQNI